MGRVKEALLATPREQVVLPAIVAYEIEYGLVRQPDALRKRAQWEEFRAAVRILPFDALAAVVAARMRAQLEAAGQSIGPHDVMIAGTAAAAGAVLVTHNLREFGRIPDLAVTDWY